jgi:hypothetical protein
MAGGMSELYSSITTQQLVILFPLFRVKMPANVLAFYSELKKIAFFDVIDTEEFLEEYYPVNDDGELDVTIEQLSFVNNYWIYNMGSAIIWIVI